MRPKTEPLAAINRERSETMKKTVIVKHQKPMTICTIDNDPYWNDVRETYVYVGQSQGGVNRA